MIGRFKNALINAVSSTTTENSSTNGNASNLPTTSVVVGTTSGTNSRQPFSTSNYPSTTSNKSTYRVTPSGTSAKFNSLGRTVNNSRPVKYEYSRPHFLNLTTLDEIQVTADHTVRPIIVPRDLSNIPWNTGYAETINSGKSKKNEDQATIYSSILKIPVNDHEKDVPRRNRTSNKERIETLNNAPREEQFVQIPYRYFGMFDGHAGPGAAVAASKRLHLIIHERLMDIGEHLIDDGPFCDRIKGKGIMWFPQNNVTNDSLIVGALEAAFHEMDLVIEEENKLYEGVNGGCTAVVCLFILGKVFVCNAGDSRAILCQRNFDAVALSDDFTPESERTRVRQLAHDNPSLLGTEFTSLEFIRRPVKKDIGTKMLYRGAYMTGWAYKIAVPEDTRFPVVFGQGKRSRVLGTIGVTRGFGDHELCAHSTSIRIKPFLSPHPQVRIVDLSQLDLGEDDVIVMGTDGLFDVTHNNTVASIVFNTIDQFPATDQSRFKYRYISAAQDLVMFARGKFIERNWRMSDGSAATIDDISVFVIPILPYKLEHETQEAMKKILTEKSANACSDPTEIVQNGILHEEETIEYEPAVRLIVDISEKAQQQDVVNENLVIDVDTKSSPDVVTITSPVESLEENQISETAMLNNEMKNVNLISDSVSEVPVEPVPRSDSEPKIQFNIVSQEGDPLSEAGSSHPHEEHFSSDSNTTYEKENQSQ